MSPRQQIARFGSALYTHARARARRTLYNIYGRGNDVWQSARKISLQMWHGNVKLNFRVLDFQMKGRGKHTHALGLVSICNTRARRRSPSLYFTKQFASPPTSYRGYEQIRFIFTPDWRSVFIIFDCFRPTRHFGRRRLTFSLSAESNIHNVPDVRRNLNVPLKRHGFCVLSPGDMRVYVIVDVHGTISECNRIDERGFLGRPFRFSSIFPPFGSPLIWTISKSSPAVFSWVNYTRFVRNVYEFGPNDVPFTR